MLRNRKFSTFIPTRNANDFWNILFLDKRKKRSLAFFSNSIFVGPVLRGYRRTLQWLHCRLFDKNLRQPSGWRKKNYKNITTFVKLAFLLLIHAFTESRIETSAWTKKQAFFLCFRTTQIPLHSLFVYQFCVCVWWASFSKVIPLQNTSMIFMNRIFCADLKESIENVSEKNYARDHCFRAIFLRSQCICSWSLCIHLSANLTANRQEKKKCQILEKYWHRLRRQKKRDAIISLFNKNKRQKKFTMKRK